MRLRQLVLVAGLALAAPASAAAQWGTAVPRSGIPAGAPPAYRDGYTRGVNAGADDRRRGDRFDYKDEQDYRRAEDFYRQGSGNRNAQRDEFRRGFEVGYREGYDRPVSARGRYDDYGYGGYGSGGYGNRTYGNGTYGNGTYGYGRADLAQQNGFGDGYQAGLNDYRAHRRFEPTDEGRYKSGDRGYESSYGPKDAYRARYRDAFIEGYRQAFGG